MNAVKTSEDDTCSYSSIKKSCRLESQFDVISTRSLEKIVDIMMFKSRQSGKY